MLTREVTNWYIYFYLFDELFMLMQSVPAVIIEFIKSSNQTNYKASTRPYILCWEIPSCTLHLLPAPHTKRKYLTCSWKFICKGKRVLGDSHYAVLT